MDIEKKIEALLFYKNEPLTPKDIAKTLSVSEKEVAQALLSLEENLIGRGVNLITNQTTYALATASDCASFIEDMRKEELSKELSKASLETLAIIAYQGEVTRADIDYIRGVNSSFILRSLLIRDLVEKIPHPRDSRTFLYRPSLALLAHLGATSPKDFPDYDKYHNEILQALEKKTEETESLEAQVDENTDNAF